MKRVFVLLFSLFVIFLIPSVIAGNVSIVHPQSGEVIIEQDIFIELPKISEQISVSRARASLSINDKKLMSSQGIGEEYDLQNSELITWNVERVRAPYVWNESRGEGIKVALLDTGIGAHSDLSVDGSVSFIDDFPENDFVGHGTMVAGVLAARENEFGIIGVAPNIELYSIKIMNESGGFLSDILDGIDWAIENDMDIISMSFGSPVGSEVFELKLAEAYNAEIVIVASSGNDGGNILFPARFPSVVAVGNIDINNEVPFGNIGVSQELVAPGTEIITTFPGNNYVIASGTSFSSPHAAGVAALILSKESMTPSEVRNKMQEDVLDLGIPGKDEIFGYGLLQASFSEKNSNVVDLEERVSVLEEWSDDFSFFVNEIFLAVSNLLKITNNHEERISSLEIGGVENINSPNYFKFLSSSDRKRVVCGYGEELHLDKYEDLGWDCKFTYRETSRGERVSCRCKKA